VTTQEANGPDGLDYQTSTALYYFLDNSHKHVFFFNTRHPCKKSQLSLVLRNNKL